MSQSRANTSSFRLALSPNHTMHHNSHLPLGQTAQRKHTNRPPVQDVNYEINVANSSNNLPALSPHPRTTTNPNIQHWKPQRNDNPTEQFVNGNLIHQPSRRNYASNVTPPPNFQRVHTKQHSGAQQRGTYIYKQTRFVNLPSTHSVQNYCGNNIPTSTDNNLSKNQSQLSGGTAGRSNNFDIHSEESNSINVCQSNSIYNPSVEHFSQNTYHSINQNTIENHDGYSNELGGQSLQESHEVASLDSLVDQCSRPQSRSDIITNMKFENDLRTSSVSPMSIQSQMQMQMDYESGSSMPSQSPFSEHSTHSMPDTSVQQCFSVIDHKTNSTLVNAMSHPITPESAVTSPFDFIANDHELNDILGQSMNETYTSERIDNHSEQHSGMDSNVLNCSYSDSCQEPVSSDNLCQNYRTMRLPDVVQQSGPSHQSIYSHSKQESIRNLSPSHNNLAFMKPQPVSPNLLNYSQSQPLYNDANSKTSPLQCNVPISAMTSVTKTEIVFTPPPSPFESSSHLNYGYSSTLQQASVQVISSDLRNSNEDDILQSVRLSHVNVPVATNYPDVPSFEDKNSAMAGQSYNAMIDDNTFVPENFDVIYSSVPTINLTSNCTVKPENSFNEYQQFQQENLEGTIKESDDPANAGTVVSQEKNIDMKQNSDSFKKQRKDISSRNKDKQLKISKCHNDKLNEEDLPKRRSSYRRREQTKSKGYHNLTGTNIEISSSHEDRKKQGKSDRMSNTVETRIPVMRIKRKKLLTVMSVSSNNDINQQSSSKVQNSYTCSTVQNSTKELGNSIKRDKCDTIDISCISESSLASPPSTSSEVRLRLDNVEPKQTLKNSTNTTSQESKICGVCGDVAKSMHFGGMACDSCKAFFRRSVQGQSWKEFTCSGEKKCTISKKNRKNCQYCRFAKCRSNGMEVSWVMTEAERMALWKSRLSKHRKDSNVDRDGQRISSKRPRGMSVEDPDDPDHDNSNTFDSCDRNEPRETQSSPNSSSELKFGKNENRVSNNSVHHSSVKRLKSVDDANCDSNSESNSEDQLECIDVTRSEETGSGGIIGTTIQTFDPEYQLDSDDLLQINNLIALQEAVFQIDPYPKECFGDTSSAIANIFVFICKKMGTFFYRVDDFHLIGKGDQTILLRSGISMSIYLHGAYGYDSNKRCFPRSTCREALKVPYSTLDAIGVFSNSSGSHDLLVDFYERFSPIMKDEGVLVMLTLVTIFQVTGVHDQLFDRRLICDLREKYITLLSRYLQFRQGMQGITETLPMLLKGLENTREIAEYHTKVDINPSVLASDMMVSTTNTSYSHQMGAMRNVMQQALTGHHSEYSSVLGSSGSNASVLNLSPNSKLEYHHSLTNAIFGPHDSTDVLFTDALEHIAQYKEKLLSISYEPVSFLKYRIPPASESSADDLYAAASPISSTDASSLHSGCSKDNEKEEALSTSFPLKKITISPSPASAPSQLELTSHDDPTSSNTSDKKKGIKVLCEMLEYISQCDDPEAIESLQNSLPPQVLKNLAKKLNID